MQVAELIEQIRIAVETLNNIIKSLKAEKEEIDNTKYEGFLSTLFGMRRELSYSLVQAIDNTVALLLDHNQELTLVETILADSNTFLIPVRSAIEDAVEDALTTLDDANTLIIAHTKYSNGTKGLLKRRSRERYVIEDKALEFSNVVEKLCPCGINKSACQYHKD